MKKIFAIAVITAMMVSTLCGCGKKNDVVETTTTTAVEEPTTVTEELTTVEPTEESTEATPSEAETTVNLPSDEYLVDYPLTVGDQKVYIRIPDNYTTFEDKMDFWGNTYANYYTSTNRVYLFPNSTTETAMGINEFYAEYSIKSDADECSGAWYLANKDNPNIDGIVRYEVETESFENGFILYSVKIVYDNYISDPAYFIEYPISDTECINIYLWNNINYADQCNELIDYYRNVENPVDIQ